MKRIAVSMLVCGLVGFAGAATAAELVTTVGQGKGGQTVISFDIASDVELAGFNFEVQIPGLSEGKSKVSNCGAELPAGFDASCRVKDGVLMMFAVSNKPDVGVGPGIAGVGTVEISGVALAKNKPLTVVSMDASNQAGQSVGLTLAAPEGEAIAK